MKLNTNKFYLLILVLWFSVLPRVGQAQTYIQEAIDLHSDREIYIAGEDVFFDLQCVDAAFGLPSPLSTIAYIELWDQNGDLKMLQKYILDSGRVSSSFQLNKELGTGYYQIRAYTRWMANDVQDGSIREIAVLQSNVSLPIAPKNENTYVFNASFFPEGGQLVAGINGILGVQLEFSNAPDTMFMAVLETQFGEKIQEISINPDGLGKIQFTPKENQSYVLNIPSSKQKFPLPEVSESGLVLSIEERKDNLIYCRIFSNESSQSSYFLYLEKGGITFPKNEIFMADGSASFGFKAPAYLDGRMSVVVEGQDGQIKAKRHLYQTKVKQNKLNLKHRLLSNQMIEVELSTTDSDLMKGAKIGYSLTPILPELTLRQDLRHGQKDNSLLSLLQKVNLSVQKPGLIENQGHRLVGSVVDNKGTAVPDADVQLAWVSETPRVYYTRSNSMGEFDFLVNEIFGDQEIFLIAYGKDGVALRFKFEEKSLLALPEITNRKLSFMEDELPFLNRMLENFQVQAAYSDFFIDQKSQIKPSKKPFWGKSDQKINLEDYTRFTMQETFSEIVYQVEQRKRNGKVRLLVENKYSDILMTGAPLILLDGIPLSGTNELFSVSSRNIESIELYQSVFQLGPKNFHGIISLSSVNRDAKGITWPESHKRLVYGFPEKSNIEFPYTNLSPISSESLAIPRRGNLLGWGTFTSTSTNPQFRIPQPELSGVYELKVWGRLKSGEPIELREKITLSN
ncbi:MAG: hypothetical protein MRZ79_13585 [Bacteroidia bacterium]|nr:hypothetical protein [Bacteroidia bacterium]